MKKRGFIYVVIIVLSLTIFSGCALRQSSQQSQTYTVARQTVESTVNISGIARYDPEVAAISTVSGKVTRLYLKENDKVKTGDSILEIDSTVAQNSYNNALNSYEIAKLSYSIAQSTDLNNSLAQAQTSRDSAEASYEIAKLNLTVAQKTDNSEVQVKQAEEQVRTAEINLDNARLNLESLEKTNTSDESVNITQFQVQNAQLSLAIAQLSLKNLKDSSTYEENVKVAEEQLRQAKLNEDIAQKRLDEASKNANTPDEEFSILEDQLEIAQSNVSIAGSNLEKVKNPSTPTDDQTQQAEYQVDQANLSLKIAMENYSQATKARDAKELQIKTAENQVAQAESQLTTAQENLQMAKNSSSASEDSINIRKLQVEQAKATLDNAESSLTNARDQIKINDMKIKQADYQVKQAYSSLQTALQSLKNYTITSPIDGSIILLNVTTGDTVSPGMSIATVGGIGEFIAEGYADEIDAVNIKAGQSVTITFDSFQSAELQGEVKYVASAKTTAPQGILAYKVDIKIPANDLNLKSGLGVNFDILTDKKEGVIAVPIESILVEDGKSYVDLVEDNGNIKRIEVQTGISSSTYTEITSGLNVGQIILQVPEGSVFTNVNNRGIFGGGQ